MRGVAWPGAPRPGAKWRCRRTTLCSMNAGSRHLSGSLHCSMYSELTSFFLLFFLFTPAKVSTASEFQG